MPMDAMSMTMILQLNPPSYATRRRTISLTPRVAVVLGRRSSQTGGSPMDASDDRFALLEERLRRTQIAFVSLLVLVIVVACVSHSAAASHMNTILRVRGIV